MFKLAPSLVAALLLASSLVANPAQAQPARVFVSAQGSDGNACSFTAPCRTFQHAHDVLAAGGEIDVLDPAGYGALTVTKAISIQGHGFAGITVSDGNAITVSAGPTDIVTLCGLLLSGTGGVGAASNGIGFTTGGALTVQDTMARNFRASGIAFNPSAASRLTVVGTQLIANEIHGVFIDPVGSQTVTGTLDHVVSSQNGSNGYLIEDFGNGVLQLTIANGTISENGAFGIVVGQGAEVVVRSSIISNHKTGNGTGLLANGASAKLHVSGSSITGNTLGLQVQNGGTLESFGDNLLRANTTDGAPTATFSLK